MDRQAMTRDQIISDLMGKEINVVIDRPIGYRHGEIIYPVNYGYLPGIFSGDGEEQDVYLLGIDEPVSSFKGYVIGAALRQNDCEDKLVMAPIGTVYHQGEIAERIYFQEQYFDSKIISIYRKSCGIIPYRKVKDSFEYLILLQNNGSWSFPKGHMEAFENETQTALRELKEETGLSAKIEERCRVSISYDISPNIKKQVVLFFAEVAGNILTQKEEIRDFLWVKKDELKQYLHPDTYSICKEYLN